MINLGFLFIIKHSVNPFIFNKNFVYGKVSKRKLA